MNRLFLITVLFLTLIFLSDPLKAENLVQHNLQIALYPKEHRLIAKDLITLPENILPEIQFLLHKGLSPSTPSHDVRIVQQKEGLESVPVEIFKVILPPGKKKFILEYSGEIFHPLKSYGKEHARGFRETPGVISSEGVYLSGSSFWYPILREELLTFNLQVDLPIGWTAVAQGERTLNEEGKNVTSIRWESPEPQNEIFVIAAEFTEYTKPASRGKAMVFLRTPDKRLAKKYLDGTVQYMAMYEKLIGPYPYKKFALVENFWETGFGMPSFALLGSKVIRFPFIMDSSYPHEILHNWWGNSVFPDYGRGNWAEGLTAYLSDHLIKEQKGGQAEYRQEALQKYADYVFSTRDFPLTQFQSRHSSSTEAVGYGKSLMFFHMLRQELGGATFIKGLQDFYQKNKFRSASFDDLRKSFEDVSGKNMEPQFVQWVTRSGAPQLQVSRVQAKAETDGYFLTALLEQVQPEAGYLLNIPVAVTMEGLDQAYQTLVPMVGKRMEMKLNVSSQPLRLDVDPEFDLFRRLHRQETPPALTWALGAKRMLILLPSSSNRILLQAYRDFSQLLSQLGPDKIEILHDTEFDTFPSDVDVVLLGFENKFKKEIVSSLSSYDVITKKTSLRFGGVDIQRKKHSIVVTLEHPANKNRSLTWIASDLPEALAGLGRKLPHYHKQSYLVFQGKEPVNLAKGRWPVLNSPLTVYPPLSNGMIRKVERAKLAKREALISH